MEFRNGKIKEVGIKAGNAVDKPHRLEMKFILGDKVETECYIRISDINFGDKVNALMYFANVYELNKIKGKYVKLAIDEYGYIVCIGHILEDDYFFVKATRSNIEKLERFTEEKIKKMESK